MANGYVRLTLQFEQDGDLWVGTCLELSTSTYSESFDQVREDLNLLVVEHLNLLEEAGERERFFQEHNVQLYSEEPRRARVRLPIVDMQHLHENPLYQPGLFPVGGLR